MLDAFVFLGDALSGRRVVLERLAMERLEVGFEAFGDSVFTRAAPRIEQELDEELADALVYACSLLWREQRRG